MVVAKVGRLSRLWMSRRSSSYSLVLTMLLMLSILFLLLLALGIVFLPAGARTSLGAVDLNAFLKSGVEREYGLGERGEQWTEILSWEPRAFIYHNFLSKDECEYLIELAKPHMQKSTVVDSKTGRSKDSRVRTSSGMFLRRGRDKIISNIEKRIADFSFIPSMGRDFRFFTMKLDRNMNLTLTTSLMTSTLRMGDKGLQLSLCICQMLKKVVRLCSLLPREIIVQFLGGMNCLNVAKRVFQLNQRWEMLCSSGA